MNLSVSQRELIKGILSVGLISLIILLHCAGWTTLNGGSDKLKELLWDRSSVDTEKQTGLRCGKSWG